MFWLIFLYSYILDEHIGMTNVKRFGNYSPSDLPTSGKLGWKQLGLSQSLATETYVNGPRSLYWHIIIITIILRPGNWTTCWPSWTSVLDHLLTQLDLCTGPLVDPVGPLYWTTCWPSWTSVLDHLSTQLDLCTGPLVDPVGPLYAQQCVEMRFCVRWFVLSVTFC